MLITTTDFIPGREIIEVLDIARGSTVRARNLGRDIFAGLKNLVGGETGAIAGAALRVHHVAVSECQLRDFGRHIAMVFRRAGAGHQGLPANPQRLAAVRAR